ncbi:nucleotide exchange factor GrpE [Lunatibacter salilacus]|uniref:nucleotide exchange factor GrpE n=1 Tax=Lunatibacter salilacus TaxID=2483804 RepID=UPI00131C0131|nr:nucleotide exchange factor GrpE [Lunatibacter salilacus]
MEEKENLEQEEMIDASQTANEENAGEEKDNIEGKSNSEEKALSIEEKLGNENKELKEKYLRLYSEFENYRRRTAKERLDLIKTASEDVIQEMILVLDDFERAFKAEDKDNGEKSSEGRQLIYNKMVKILASKGLKSMDELVGENFDADRHEAITQIPAPSEDLKGKIVDVIERGYLLGDKVIRYAKVVIGN